MWPARPTPWVLPMLRTIELPRDEQAPGRARNLIRSLRPELGEQVVRDACLLISEVVSNSVVHGEGRSVRMVIDTSPDGRLRCEVIDDGDGFVPRARAADQRTGGWGLEIVERVADRWGVREGSTHVWFELSRSAPAL